MRIGSARMNELGQLEGGKAGDQNKLEVSTQDWYLHDKGWYVIRAKDPYVRFKIAEDMMYACDNDYVGYSYWEHCYTLFDEVKKYNFNCSKVKIPCETNCAKLVRVCVLYAGVNCGDFHTGTEVDVLKATGKFDILTDPKYCNSPNLLLQGDILVTRTKGHTVVCLEDGVKEGIPYRTANCAFVNVRAGGTLNAKILTTLKGGTLVELIGWAESGWGRIRCNGIEGYISPMYIEELPKAVCKYGNAWLRTKAGRLTTDTQIVTIPMNETVHITGQIEMVGQTPWYEVVYKRNTGWASGKYIKPVK